jgi:hypothetical protein
MEPKPPALWLFPVAHGLRASRRRIKNSQSIPKTNTKIIWQVRSTPIMTAEYMTPPSTLQPESFKLPVRTNSPTVLTKFSSVVIAMSGHPKEPC